MPGFMAGPSREEPVKTILLAVLSGSLLLATLDAAAQSPARVRGIVDAFDGKVRSVKARGGETAVRVADDTVIVYTQPIAIGDIRPGDFLGVTSMRGAEGTLSAFEVRRFPKPVNPGHRPFDGRDDQTMTNATVEAAVESASGRELTLSYKGGAQKIIVPPDASISTLVPGNRSQLLRGAEVNLTAAPGPDGALVARRIQVSPVKR
jgi:hypothetical protein